MTKVKICGITRIADAASAVALGADMLGFNFVGSSPRNIEPGLARSIVSQFAGQIISFGVFVDMPIPELIEVAKLSNVDTIQLHGNESPDYVSKLRERTGRSVIKAFRTAAGFDPRDVPAYGLDDILIDSYSPGAYGGTGEMADWDTAITVRPIVARLYLAGGLNSENIGDAIKTVRPYAVDVANGVESSPGVKDSAKMEAFIFNARNA